MRLLNSFLPFLHLISFSPKALKAHFERNDVEIEGKIYNLVINAVRTDNDSKVIISLAITKTVFFTIATTSINFASYEGDSACE